MSEKLESLRQLLAEKLGDKVQHSVIANGELTVVVPAAEYLAIAYLLRDDPDLRFEQLVDLTGLDYSTFSGQDFSTRFAVAVHLLSVSRNLRLRVRVLAPDDSFPMLDSMCEVWPSANWFEREAFDLFGIVFRGHPDLRRILTDYGFVGYPFRKDFPISGYVEMRYDQEQGRVVYQSVTIEPRENTPRIVRDDNYGNSGRG
ncbi:NADH-quinone oxidoreductase subunit C [Zoogloea sp.]|jgi:NADH-quinone oxidoreductase subunit C|uniref:NADH-quinone oxidoreductase subunit C n=1 Tax=Zoogloea sp. TaxID=49181 RepID=UPI001D7B6EDC|nr:NADH-quinone oxidoreductase subunit C [Zoogloea sp.]MBK6652859.1 NADH-quinone oxidoreductase subunit C [Zoogloea sp.]MBK7848327.1 NADH-quinone oxidoreductase subunit C [Zoogloea sp.]HOX99940.1 NADH-quinone oxidoreductase subunit C [Zoogloea sp.]HPI58616.1 NADH-quinone oxidoreductase subunit C [Zoogloea sp.]